MFEGQGDYDRDCTGRGTARGCRSGAGRRVLHRQERAPPSDQLLAVPSAGRTALALG